MNICKKIIFLKKTTLFVTKNMNRVSNFRRSLGKIKITRAR